jgi:hypothetical protein
MRSDPEPYAAFCSLFSQCSIVETHPDGPEDANLFQPERRMARARLQKREVLIRKIPNVLRQLPIMQPELRSREVLQSGEHRPASKSSSTRFAAASNPPALISSSIRRSHRSAINSSNHAEKRARSLAESREMADSKSSTLISGDYCIGATCANTKHPPYDCDGNVSGRRSESGISIREIRPVR